MTSGGTGIRTQAPVSRPTGFQDRTLQPLGYSSRYHGGPYRTRTYDQSVMSRPLWPTELRVQLVAGVRVEPTTSRVWTECSNQLSYPATTLTLINGRDDRIRTCDPLVPNQVHYQAVQHPVHSAYLYYHTKINRSTFFSKNVSLCF